MVEFLVGFSTLLLLSFTPTFANVCNFPSTWRDGGGTFMLKVVDNNNHIDYIKYYHTNCYTARSDKPTSDTTGRAGCNCPAYQSLSDGSQRYLRIGLGKQTFSNGLCFERKRYSGLLIGREAGSKSTLAECRAAISNVNLYHFLLPVHIKPNGGWTLADEVDFPLPLGPYKLTCQLRGSDICPPNSAASIQAAGSQTAMYIATNAFNKYTDWPLAGTVKCVADLSPTVLGEPASNDRILILMWTTNNQANRVFFYCVRYKLLSNGVWSLSLDVQDTDRVECSRGASHDWHGLHGNPKREYFKMVFQYSGISTKIPPTTLKSTTPSTQAPQTPSPPTPTPRPSVYHLQILVTAMHDSYSGEPAKARSLGAALTNSLASTCHIDTKRLKGIILEKGPNGVTMATYQIEEGSPTVHSCKSKMVEQINGNHGIIHNNEEIFYRESIYTWTDDSACPDIKCKPGSSCWIRQGDYVCECAASTRSTLGRCPTSVSSLSTEWDRNRIITFSVVGVAALLVVICIVVIVIIIRKRRRTKEAASDQDSIGSLEQQDRDMYSSIGKKPTAFHDRSFMVDDDDASDHGEKTGIHSSAYM